MLRKILFFLTLLIFNNITAVDEFDAYSNALKFFNNKEYATAYSMFKSISEDLSFEEQKRINSYYYTAECLVLLEQFDGAATVYEFLITEYPFSNFREDALYKLGIIYFNRAEYRRARERLSILLNSYPNSINNGSALYWIAESFAAENRFYEAEEYFNNAISTRVTNIYIVNSIFSLAQLYEKAGNYKEAVTNYDELLAYYKNHELAPKAQLRIGVCYFNLKEYDNAVLELTDPLIKNLHDKEIFEAKYFLAASFIRLKDYKNALAVLEEISNENLSQEELNKITYSVAWIKFQTNDYESAYNYFSELSQKSQDTLSISALYWSGEARRYMGENEAANQIYNSFVNKYPDHPLANRAKLGKGTVFFSKNQSAEAEAVLLEAAQMGDDLTKGKALTLLGEISLNKKNFENARNNFSRAVQFTSRDLMLNVRALLGLGIVEYYLNNYNNAVRNLQEIKTKVNDFENDKVNFYLAESYLARGEYAAALRHYNQVSDVDNTLKKQTIYGKAYAYFNMKDFSNSVYYFNEFSTKFRNDPNTADARLRLADSYFGIKNFDRASAIYRDLFSRDRAALNDQTYYQYCQSLFKAGKSSEAIQEFANLQRRFPSSQYADASQYVIGWIYFQQNNFREAINNYNQLITKYPRSQLRPIVYYSMGDSYFNLGQYDSSIVFYNKVLEEFPNTTYILDAVNGIQYAYLAKDQIDNAVNFIDRFINSNPNSRYSDQLFFKKGDIYYSMDDYSKAAEAYRDFVTKYPSSPLVSNAYYWIGKSSANLKRTNEAIDNFNIVLERTKKSDISISAALDLAAIYIEQKQFSTAIKVLNSIIESMPTSNSIPELLFIRASAEYKENKLADAINSYDQIITYYDGSIFASKSKVELGIIEINRKNYENAINLLKEAAENRLDDIGAQAQYYLGVALFDQEKTTDAVTAFVRVRSIFAAYDEWYTKSLLKLGDCYVKLNDKRQAREMYRAVLARHRTGEYAQEANRKMNRL